MAATKPLVAILLAAAMLAACGPRHSPQAPGAAGGARGAGEPYLTPPRVEAVQAGPGGITLSGSGPPRTKGRLATPQGYVITGNIDKHGRWAMALGPATEPRIFGLSASGQGRTVQAEGYVLVTPAGQAALLRAGAGAVRLDGRGRAGLRAIDFDGSGGVEVSAAAPPGATAILRLDGRQVAQGRADPTGRYAIELPAPGARQPIAPGIHRLQLYVDGTADAAAFQLSPAQPLAPGLIRSQLTGAGLRVDWTTPGGGVQSTILVH